MKLIQSIYEDPKGNHWVVKRVILPKTKGGDYIYWEADCMNFNMGYRADKKTQLFNKIKNHKN